MNINILIVEDEVLIARDIKITLEEIGYDVCSICYNSETALKDIYRCRPDLVLLDITIPGQKDGIGIANVLNDQHQIPFVYLTSHSDEATLERAKLSRPWGYIVKPFKDSDLKTSVQIALFNHGEMIKRRSLSKESVDLVADNPLSNKEYDIFMDLIEGKNNTEIAKLHYISINTVKTHIKHIFEKLDVHDRVTAVKKVLTKL